MTRTDTTLAMTAAARDRLEQELAHLREHELPAALQALTDARTDSVNLGESGTHQSALEVKEQVDKRIADLRSRLARARVVEVVDTDRVSIGCIATVRFSDGEEEEFLVDDVASGGHINLSPKSPMGAALIGARCSDEVFWDSPGGRMGATVLDIRAA